MQITQRASNQIYVENYGMYMGTNGYGPAIAKSPNEWGVQGLGGARRLLFPGELAPLTVCSQWSMAECPRSTFEERCTPLGRPIAANDTCRHTAEWPSTYSPLQSSHNRNRNRNPTHDQGKAGPGQQKCPPWKGGSSNIYNNTGVTPGWAKELAREYGIQLRPASACAGTAVSMTSQGQARAL